MLRHFKMEMLKRQQEELAREKSYATQTAAMPTDSSEQLASSLIIAQPLQQQKQQLHRLEKNKSELAVKGAQRNPRGRRAGKPQMEKRRRARINECLDILKSYVLTDSTNLTHLGIDPAASENQDEETIARSILKSSGLIHRHRGRKNPNKLEKADILELTVDYVRRLHEQRNELLLGGSCRAPSNGSHEQDQVINLKIGLNANGCENQRGRLLVPVHLSEPLTLDLSPESRLQHAAGDLLLAQAKQHNVTPLTPPPSSVSSMHSCNDDSTSVMPQMLLSRVLDSYNIYEMLPCQQQKC